MGTQYWTIAPDDVRHDLRYLAGLRDSSGVSIDARVFTRGERIEHLSPLRLPVSPFGESDCEVRQPLRVAIAKEGTLPAFSFTDEDAPVVTDRILEVIKPLSYSDFQHFPARVDGDDLLYQILNVYLADCVDWEQSTVEWWGSEAPPQLAGKPMYVSNLVIDPTKIRHRHLFRPAGWSVLVASAEMKQALESIPAIGIQFVPDVGLRMP